MKLNEKEKKTYDWLMNSFEQNFVDDSSDKEHFLPAFCVVSERLCTLDICDAFVDVGRKKDLVDFNLVLPDNIFLVITKYIYKETDDVMFAIARNHKTLVIDERPLEEVIQNVQKVLKEIKNIDKTEQDSL